MTRANKDHFKMVKTTIYDLYLESGPKRRKTMVHVLDLLGCVAVGGTTEQALEATPEAIRLYRRFLLRHGEVVDTEADIETRIAEHITEGQWLGNGSPYLMFAPDYEPVSDEEIDIFMRRFEGLRQELTSWAMGQSDEELNAAPEAGGRTAKTILLHVLGATGGYLAAALGGAPGFSRIYGLAERGELSPVDALQESGRMAVGRVRATTTEERDAVIERPKDTRTLRKAIRRMLEHDWEHLAELSRRPGGPEL